MSEQACGLCGKDPAAGFATVDDVRYCHGDEDALPTCYMSKQFESGRAAVWNIGTREVRVTEIPLMSRWNAFGQVERMMVHHALRMLLTHPGTHGVERDLAERLADEIWDEHATEVSRRSSVPESNPR